MTMHTTIAVPKLHTPPAPAPAHRSVDAAPSAAADAASPAASPAARPAPDTACAPAGGISSDAVAHALRHIRDRDALASSPLCRLPSVRQAVVGRGRGDDHDDRDDDVEPADAAIALAARLREVVANALSAHRGATVPSAAQTRGDLEDGLLGDFGAGDADREAWSVLYHRFTAPSRLPAKRIERMGGWSRRTILRRANLGFELVCDALGDAERPVVPVDRPAEATAPAAMPVDAARADGWLPGAWRRATTVLEMSTGASAGRRPVAPDRRVPDRAALRAIAASMLIDHLESALGEAWRAPWHEAPAPGGFAAAPGDARR